MRMIYRGFTIVANYKGNKVWPCDIENHNNHRVTVTNNTDNTRKAVFDYWMGMSTPKMTTAVDVLRAFEAFISDALSATHHTTYKDFCLEYGLDPFTETATKSERKVAWGTYQGCISCLEKYNKLTDEDIASLYENVRADIEDFNAKEGNVSWAKTLRRK